MNVCGVSCGTDNIVCPYKRKKQQPWITEQLKTATKKMQQIFDRKGKTEKLKKNEKRCSKAHPRGKEKKNYYANEIQALKNKNPQKVWGFINKVLCSSKSSGETIQIDCVEK
jgi:hypothetical protein